MQERKESRMSTEFLLNIWKESVDIKWVKNDWALVVTLKKKTVIYYLLIEEGAHKHISD